MLARVPSAGAERAATRQIAYTQWDGATQWRAGTFAGTKVQQQPAGAGRADRPRAATPARSTTRALGLAMGRARVRPHRAGPVLVGPHPRATPGWRSGCARRAPAVSSSSWDVLGRLDLRRPPHQTTDRVRSDRRPRRVDVDTWRSASARPAWRRTRSGCSCSAERGCTGTPSVDAVGAVASRLPAGRSRVRLRGPAVGKVLDVPRLLPDGAPRPLPRMGQRRRGLVLAHVDLDGARLLRRAAEVHGVPLGAGRPHRPVGRLCRPDDLRLRATKAPATGPSTPRTPHPWPARRS